MYWRVKKFSPEELVRQYRLPALLAASLLFNLIALPKFLAKPGMGIEQKLDYVNFGKRVASHLLDSNYLTFDKSMIALRAGPGQGELIPEVYKQQPSLPKTPQEQKAIARTLANLKSVSSIIFGEVEVEVQNDRAVIKVPGVVVAHDAEGLKGPSPFLFQFRVGQWPGTTVPVVAEIQELDPGQQLSIGQ